MFTSSYSPYIIASKININTTPWQQIGCIASHGYSALLPSRIAITYDRVLALNSSFLFCQTLNLKVLFTKNYMK